MIYKIENKKLKVILKDEMIKLPAKLKKDIDQNFENIKNTGANIWNGELICVSECNIDDDKVEIICKKSDYAHYIYEEKIGCSKEYECMSLSAGCLIETLDGYYVIGELDEFTSYPTMLQVTGGGIDKTDILNKEIDIEKTIVREANEELKINLNNKNDTLYNRISYMYISEENELSGVQLFSKAKIKMTAKEMKEHFENYYKYLKENNLELEFKRLHFWRKEKAIEKLKKINNPRRNYLMSLLQIDLKNN